MIEYIIPNNIDDRILNRASRLLEDGALLALPTDTSWSLVCSLKSSVGIKKLRRLSGERDERHFTLLCSNISQLAEVCSVNNSHFRLIKRLSPGPYVFILKTLHGTGKTLDVKRKEAGVRIPDHPVPIRLIETLGFPLYSITAKKSMINSSKDDNEDTDDNERLQSPIPEEEFFESGWELEDINGVDLILDPGEERERVYSTILDLCTDEVTLLRKGAGIWPA